MSYVQDFLHEACHEAVCLTRTAHPGQSDSLVPAHIRLAAT